MQKEKGGGQRAHGPPCKSPQPHVRQKTPQGKREGSQGGGERKRAAGGSGGRAAAAAR